MATTLCPSIKVILIGEYGVGKSSLFRRFVNDSFTTDTSRKSTMGLDNYSKTYRETNIVTEATPDSVVMATATAATPPPNTISTPTTTINLNLYDTGGLERVASVTSSYYKYTEAAVLVYSLDNLNSFNTLSQYLIETLSYAESAKIFLCGNKLDLVSEEELKESDECVQEFCDQCPSTITTSYKTSCKTGVGVHAMFQDVANTLITANKSRFELRQLEEASFKLSNNYENTNSSGSSSCC